MESLESEKCILPNINDPQVKRILLRVSKSLHYTSSASNNTDIKTATTFLRKKSSILSTELCQSLRWGDSSRQDYLLKRLKRVHRDLIVLRGKSKEATNGANSVLRNTTSYDYNKGGQWLIQAKTKNKKMKERDHLELMRQSEIDVERTLSPILKRKQRPQSASNRACGSRNVSLSRLSPTGGNQHRQRPQSAQSPLQRRKNQYKEMRPFRSINVIPAGSTADFERLQRKSINVLQQLRTELKYASNDGLHGNGGNLLNDPANGALVKKLSHLYGTLYEGVNGKLNIMLEDDNS
jgi:hypothetical protein